MKIKSKKEVGEYIKQQLSIQNLRQAQLADRMLELIPEDDEDEFSDANTRKRRLTDNISKWIRGDMYPGSKYLFYLSQVLKVTIENILTAGESNEKYDDRVTLYSMAKCKDIYLIDKFMEQDEEVFINYDEFDKTLIDYVIEFKNIELIKYFFDKEIISFNDYMLISPFRVMIHTNDKRYYDILKIIIENDEVEYFSKMINRSAIVNRPNVEYPIKFDLNDEVLESVLKSKKILEFLLTPYVPNDQEWNYYNKGLMILKDNTIRKCHAISGWFNELLRVAIKCNYCDLALKIIEQGIEHNNNVAGIVGGDNYLIDKGFALQSRKCWECVILLSNCEVEVSSGDLKEKLKELDSSMNRCGRKI